MSEIKLKPTKKQLDFMDWEFGGFLHFGIRSFFMGSNDWDGNEMPASAFNPEQLDCEQWVRTYKEAGAKYLILVTKHHDGFANWPSKYTDYSVANSSWKDGKGDVVREYTDACRKYDMKVGLYYSPAQWGSAIKLDNDKEYNDYFINQIGELLTNYGKIDYLWFDGCGSDKFTFDKPRIVAAIRGMQPDLLIFSMFDPDTNWVGNEDGYAPLPNFNTVMFEDELRFLPRECDFRMRQHTWFNCQHDEDTVKSVDTLMDLYYRSVGHGANYLLNIGPDSRGLLPDKDTQRLLEFGAELKRRFSTPVLMNGPMRTFNTVVIKENLIDGESVKAFNIYADDKLVFSGSNIGHKAICPFESVTARTVRVEVTESNGEYKIDEIKCYAV